MFSLYGLYLSWHYGKGLTDLKQLFSNFLNFFFHLFSIPILLHTFFVPWHRLSEEYRGGLNVGSAFSALIINTLMRFIGALFRSILILAGLIAIIITFFAGIICFFIWLVLPLVVAGLFLNGITLLFT